jgi:NodT family efflux transporter outer membrane factor (OMF) lipoprotein
MNPPVRADRVGRWATSWLAAATLAGCALPGPQRPLAPTITAAAAGLDGAAAQGQAWPWPAADWWHALGDPALDALIDQALAGQPGLQAVAARVGVADAVAQAAQAPLGPQAALAVDANRERFSNNGLLPPPIAGSTRTQLSVQVNARLALDLFGRNAAALRAAVGQQRAAAAELQAARVLLSAQLAHGWVGLARLLAQRDLAQQTLAQHEAQRALIAQRVAAGLDNAVALRAAEGRLPETRQQIEAVDGQIALARHQLAVLAGLAPQALAGARPALAPLQLAALPDRLGADLLGRRAEVVAARWRVEAALAQIDNARAGFYPDIDLAGFVGLNALGLEKLLTLGSRQLGVGPALRLPLFDGGSLRAQLGARSAEADAAVAAYNQAVLQAAREAADASATLRAVAAQQAEQTRAAAAADATHALAEQRRRAGLANRLTVLDAETAVLAQRGVALDLHARALDAQVALMQALGGGWRETSPAVARR